MNQAREKLSADVDRATASSKKVHENVEAAKTSAGKVVNFSGTIEVKLGQLHGRVTAELRPAVQDIQTDVASMKYEEAALTQKLNNATTSEQSLAVDLSKAQLDRDTLTKEAQAYAENAQKLADDASKENNAKVELAKKLSWYRWHWFLGWFIFIAGILACVALAILKFTGKLAWAAKIP